MNTFSMIERQSPAMISSARLPFLCSVMILLFINTVHRLPRTAGFFEENAAFAISFAEMLREDAKFSRKEPHPEEQASFTRILVMIPRSSHMAFISCPPISRMNVASFTYFSAALAWATVSTV